MKLPQTLHFQAFESVVQPILNKKPPPPAAKAPEPAPKEATPAEPAAEMEVD